MKKTTFFDLFDITFDNSDHDEADVSLDKKQIDAFEQFLIQMEAGQKFQVSGANWLNDQQLTNLIDYLFNDLSFRSARKVRQQLATDHMLNEFYEGLVELKRRLDDAQALTLQPRRIMENLLSGRGQTADELPLSPQLLAWRAREAQKNGFAAVDLDSGLGVSLQFQPLEVQRQLVEGTIKHPETGQAPWDQLPETHTAWLLPAAGGAWHESTLDEMGHFTFKEVMPGSYTLEIAWPGQFIELLDVVVPAS